MKIGIIIIKDQKVYFEYYKLNPPPCHKVGREAFFKSLDKYEASKRLIEVSNVSNLCKDDIIKNPFCKAEITGDKATIVKLIK